MNFYERKMKQEALNLCIFKQLLLKNCDLSFY